MPAPPSLPLAPFPSPSAACIFSLQGSVALFQYPVPSGHLLQFVIILSIYLFWVSSPSGKPLSILLFVQGVLVSNLPFKQSEPEQRKINSELSLVQNLWLAGAWWEPSPKEVARDACLAPGRPDSDILKQFSSLKYHCVDVISPAACCFSPRQDPGICLGTIHREWTRSNQNEMSKRVLGRGASGQADVGVLKEGGQFLGHSVQLTWVGILKEVALSHEIVFQKVLAHAFVQLPHQAQECFVEDLPVLQAGIFLTSPKEHCLWREEVVSDIVLGHWGQYIELTWTWKEGERSHLGQAGSAVSSWCLTSGDSQPCPAGLLYLC